MWTANTQDFICQNLIPPRDLFSTCEDYQNKQYWPGFKDHLGNIHSYDWSPDMITGSYKWPSSLHLDVKYELYMDS